MATTIRQIAKEQQAKKSAPRPPDLSPIGPLQPALPVLPGMVAATPVINRPAGDVEQTTTFRRTTTRRVLLALAVAGLTRIGVCAVLMWRVNSGKQEAKYSFDDKQSGGEKVRPPKDNDGPINPPLMEGIVNSVGMRLAHIPAGEFTMGSPKLVGSDDERPQHKVKITKAFYLGIHEVTQGQFKQAMGYNPSYFSRDGKRIAGVVYTAEPAGGKDKLGDRDNSDQYPVENVSWEEANEYCKKLSGLPNEKVRKHLYRLPTEAEWEYACRGGATSYMKFHFGDNLT